MRLLPPVMLSLALLAGSASPASAADVPPEQPADIGTALPPGNSGFFSVEGQARGSLTDDPGQYGEHVDGVVLLTAAGVAVRRRSSGARVRRT